MGATQYRNRPYSANAMRPSTQAVGRTIICETCECATPRAEKKRLHWSSSRDKGERAIHFFSRANSIDGLLEDFRLHRHSLQLRDLSACGGQFARRYDRITGNDRRERAFALKFTPVEQLTCRHAVLTLRPATRSCLACPSRAPAPPFPRRTNACDAARSLSPLRLLACS